MTNEMRLYCDGAAMAYRDVAAKLRELIANAPPELKSILQGLEPFAAATELKAVEVYREAERCVAGRH